MTKIKNSHDFNICLYEELKNKSEKIWKKQILLYSILLINSVRILIQALFPWQLDLLTIAYHCCIAVTLILTLSEYNLRRLWLKRGILLGTFKKHHEPSTWAVSKTLLHIPYASFCFRSGFLGAFAPTVFGLAVHHLIWIKSVSSQGFCVTFVTGVTLTLVELL